MVALKQVHKDAWVEALRSGEYKQTTGTLRGRIEDTDEIGYCCLGVLCDVLVKQFPDVLQDLNVSVEVGPDEITVYRSNGDRLRAMPGMEIEAWIEGKNIPGDAFAPSIARRLVDMNDDGKTFDEIADTIETKVQVTA